jgi:hypothetical protein
MCLYIMFVAFFSLNYEMNKIYYSYKIKSAYVDVIVNAMVNLMNMIKLIT